MSTAVGRSDVIIPTTDDPSDPQEYVGMLDIDYMTSTLFYAGGHPQNKSTW